MPITYSEINNLVGTYFQSNTFEKNRWQKTIKYITNEQNKLQNINIEIYKLKYNQVRLVLAVFTSTKLALSKLEAISK